MAEIKDAERVYPVRRKDGSIALFRRTGTCQPDACGGGVCCKTIAFEATQDAEMRKLMEWRGAELVKVKDVMGEETELFRMRIGCSQQCANATCGIYATRPKVCRTFPEPHELGYLAVKDACTYGFEEVKVDFKWAAPSLPKP